MTQEEKIKQQAEYARQLLDAVYEPERIKRQRTTEQRRRNMQLKKHKKTKGTKCKVRAH